MKKILALFSMLFSCVFASANVVYVDVVDRATGVDEYEATLTALNRCVAQVCGVAIASETFHSVSEYSADTNESSEYSSQSEFLNQINSSTSGVVASYSVLSVVPREQVVEVEVAAKVVKYETMQMHRKKIAVMPVLSTRDTWEVEGEYALESDVSRVLTQALVNYLTSTRKFAILEREYDSQIEQELDFAQNNSIDPADLCKRFSATGADYVLYAVIEELSVVSSAVNTPNLSYVMERKMAKASISFRLADIATRQIVISDTINISEPISRKEVSSVSFLAKIFAEGVALQITENIYPIRVVGINYNKLTLNQGSLLVEDGMEYNVYLANEDIVDPYTGESLGNQENKCARVKILESKAKTSTALILESDIDFSRISLGENRFICRRAKSVEKPKPVSPVKSLEKEIEDKW